MTSHVVERKERAVVENHAAGYYAYLVMSWLLVVDLFLHGVRPTWTSWNGLPLDVVVILGCGGLSHQVYAMRHRTIGALRTSAIVTVIAAAAIVAAIVAILRR